MSSKARNSYSVLQKRQTHLSSTDRIADAIEAAAVAANDAAIIEAEAAAMDKNDVAERASAFEGKSGCE